MKKKLTWTILVGVVCFLLGYEIGQGEGEPEPEYQTDADSISILDCNSDGITIMPVFFTCPPECRSTTVLFKPDPVTLKREVGATVEVTGKWFCAGCGSPLDAEDPNDGVLPRLLPKLLPKVRNFIP